MEALVKIFLGFVCLLLGLGYLYRPGAVERLMEIIRDYVLNDSHIALERKKWGAFFLLMSFLFLYMGFMSLRRH